MMSGEMSIKKVIDIIRLYDDSFMYKINLIEYSFLSYLHNGIFAGSGRLNTHHALIYKIQLLHLAKKFLSGYDIGNKSNAQTKKAEQK